MIAVGRRYEIVARFGQYLGYDIEKQRISEAAWQFGKMTG